MAKKKQVRRNQNKRPQKAIKKVSVTLINYKKPEILKNFMDSRMKVLSQKITGLSAKAQRQLKTEVKKSRIMGLLPFTDRHAIS